MQKSLQKIQTKRLQKILAKTGLSAKGAAIRDVSWLMKQGDEASVTDRDCTKQANKDTEVRLQRLSRAEQAIKVDNNRSLEKMLEIKYIATSGKGGERKNKSKDKSKKGSMTGGWGNLGCRPP